MGIYDRDYNDKRFSEPKKTTLFGIRTSSNLTNLIFVNLTIFILIYFLYVIYLVTNSNESNFRMQVLNKFVLPGDLSGFIQQPWSIITFMFVHFAPFLIFTNMLWLWAFGSILEEQSRGVIIPAYIYGSLVAAIVYLCINTFFQPTIHGDFGAQYYGAASGVMAIAIAATTLNPDYRLFPNIGKGLPLWIMTLLYVIVTLVAMPFNYFMILGSALTGFLMIWFLKKGKDLGAPLNNFFDWITNLFNPDKTKKTKQRRYNLQYKSKGSPYKRTPNVNQQKIDEILDKIVTDGGTHNLTKEEKDILRRAGEEL